jgi:hypothetical protein
MSRPIRALLEARNTALQASLGQINAELKAANIPIELEPYRRQIIAICDAFVRQCERNRNDLALGRDEILEDVLSNTQQASQGVRLISARLVAPVLRASSADRLSLIAIGWLHAKHSATALYPAAFTDGDCGVWPFTQIPPVYVFPSAEQRGLLYQPLLFHEFGHLLYACHKAEMDDLVGELQKQIEDSLTPNVQRNDRHAATQASERQMIVDTWYKWTQELFCDAVGLTIGGPAFLWAFSGYLGTMDRGDFYRPPESLRYSSHPIKWLRVKLLIERARAAGYEDTAREVEEEWSAVAMTMNVREDYHGFYAAGFHRALVKTLDDMLTEADPLRCTNEGANAETFDLGRDELPFLFNAAWNSYFRNPETYSQWESETVKMLLAGRL